MKKIIQFRIDSKHQVIGRVPCKGMVRHMVCIALRSLFVRRRGAWHIMESVVTFPISFRMVGEILDSLPP